MTDPDARAVQAALTGLQRITSLEALREWVDDRAPLSAAQAEAVRVRTMQIRGRG